MSACFAFMLAFLLSGMGIHKYVAVDTLAISTICQSFCGNSRQPSLDKVISRLLCSHRCPNERTQGSKDAIMNQYSTIRLRRSPSSQPQGVCNNTTGFVGFVRNVNVNFTVSGKAIITWSPYVSDKRRWVGYMVLWSLESTEDYTKDLQCDVVSKESLSKVVDMKEANTIYVNVSTYPRGTDNNSYVLREFSSAPPMDELAPPMVSPNGKEGTPLVKIIIAIGVPVSLILVGVVFLALYWKNIRIKVDTEQQPISSEPEGREATTKDKSYTVSYYPEDGSYTEKIVSIVNWFRADGGYNVIMDKMASTEMSSLGPMEWAERQIKKAEKVLVFLSPGYVRLCGEELSNKRASDETRRVWYELRLLKAVFCNTQSAAKMVCILMDETINVHDLPPWAEVRYRWPTDRKEILKRLNNRTEFAPAQLANNPINV